MNPAIQDLPTPAGPTISTFRCWRSHSPIAFNVLASNCDDHTKNLSFILRDGGHWALAPAYDVIYAYNPRGEWTYQHLMSVNGKFNDIGRQDMLLLADRFEIGSAKRLLSRVGEAVASWPEFAKRAGVSAEATERLRIHFHTNG